MNKEILKNIILNSKITTSIPNNMIIINYILAKTNITSIFNHV